MKNTLTLSLLCAVLSAACLQADGREIDDAADLFTQQQQEKGELGDMKRELENLRGTMNSALQDMGKVQQQVQARRNMKEFQLQASEAAWELCPGTSVNALTYNGKFPGPEIRIQEGDHVKITVHNTLKTSTSLYFHGMILPQSINGLPRKGASLIAPGESYAFEFIASYPGTFWYHPQVTHADQMSRGLCGALIVEPRSTPKTYERDLTLMLGQWTVSESATGKPAGKYPLFLANGKSSPAIPPLEVRKGERIRLRVINNAREACPLFLSGHKFEVMAVSGSEATEPHIVRDTFTVQPGERADLEFTAENPGVWSLSSMIPQQSSANGRFPGGLAIVVRYPDTLK